MGTLERLGADDLASVVVAYRDCLRAHQEAINRLNVYPVPDGDTGTNMALTLEAVVAELPDVADADLASVCRAVSHGSLMGARGNSGVILSEILRGMAEAFGECIDTIGGAIIADALARAAAGAYRAVQRPVEGTILTVVKAASAAALDCRSGAPLVAVLEAARAAAGEALAATTEQLPVLKAAGVVDAGGAGFVLLLDAFLHHSAARPLPQPDGSSPAPMATAAPGASVAPGAELCYEVMYLLEAPDGAIDGFRDAWSAVGDSIVVVGGDGLFNCHIHTNDIGAAIEAALEVGRPRQIRVTDLAEQVEEEQWVRAAGLPAAAGLSPTPVQVACAVVAVSMGEGIGRIFRSLGVQQLVGGGQSMNPSTAELLAAIDAAPGRQVVLLPNNKNIFPVAEQAARVAAKPARVVATRSVTEGLAALLEYDPDAPAEDNAATMAKAAARVVSGEVTVAVRDCQSDAGAIEAGDFLGLSGGAVVAVGATAAEAAEKLLARLLAEHHEIVTLIEGDGASRADTDGITEWLAAARPDVALEVLYGGQPLYPYLLSIE